MLLPEIKLHVARGRVAYHAVPGVKFHPPLTAVVNGENAPVRDVRALVALHVEVVEAEHNARKYLVSRHRAVPGLVAELPHGAAAALCQQYRALIFKGLGILHGQPSNSLS